MPGFVRSGVKSVTGDRVPLRVSGHVFLHECGYEPDPELDHVLLDVGQGKRLSTSHESGPLVVFPLTCLLCLLCGMYCCAGVSFGQPDDPRDPWVGTAELHLSHASVNVSGPSVARATSSGASVLFGDCSVSLLGGLTIASGVPLHRHLATVCI